MPRRNKYVKKRSEDPAEIQEDVEQMRRLCLEQTTNPRKIEEITGIQDKKELRAVLLELKLMKKTMC